MLRGRVVAYFATCFLMFAGFAFSQRDLGTITGTVSDSQGAIVPEAKVVILEDATGLTYEVKTDDSGTFTRPALKSGNYSVSVEASGFSKAQQKDVIVTPNSRIAVNIALQVGNSNQTIEVTAAAPLLQTENVANGSNLNQAQVSELPLGGQRQFAFLARLSPGVVPAEPGARDASGGGFSANGVRSNGQNNYLLNGIDNNVNVIDFLNQTSFVINPSVEAIGDFQVITSGGNAEYGRGAGGVLNTNFKTGTNEFHGVAFEILQNDKLNANRWESNRAGAARNAFKQNQFGGAIGGPIVKNKLFFFGDYQGTRIASAGGSVLNLGYGQFYTIPTPQQRTGDFSGLLGGVIGNDALGRPVRQNAIYDPSSTRTAPNGQLVRDPFVNNIIPASRFDPAAARLMALFPNPNQAFASGNYPQNNYYIATPGAQNADQGDIRMDYRLSDKDSLAGSLSWSNVNKSSVPPFQGALNGGNFNGNSEVTLGRSAQISYTRTWTPSFLSETRIGFSRLVTSRAQAGTGVDQFAAFGINGYNPTANSGGGLPQIGAGRYSQFGSNNWLPTTEYSNVWDFIQNVAINTGKHSMKYGFEFRPIKFPFYQFPFPNGELNFNQNETALPSTGTSRGRNGSFNTDTGDEMASFLLGSVNNGQVSTTNFISSQKLAIAFYAQDDWKITPKLTLNLGVRYELFSPIDERFGRQSNFLFEQQTLYIPEGKDQDTPLPNGFTTQFPGVRVSRGEVSSYLIDWDKTNIAPRFGIAYNMFPKTVVRASFGIYYGGEENQGGFPNRGESAPFNYSPTLVRPGNVGLFQPNPYFNGGAPTGQFTAGYPSNVFSIPAQLQLRSIYANFRNGQVNKWSFNIQQQLSNSLALDVGYQGNHQSKQLLQPDPNAPANIGTTDSNITANTRRPIPSLGSISGTASFGYGNYHALTAKLEKRMSGGLQFIASYTFGHALSNSGTPLSGSPGLGVIDPRDFSTSYTNASWDIRHNFTFGYNWAIPFGKGQTYGANLNPVVQTIIGNWQANGIASFRTGSPFTLRANSCQGVWNACLPDRNGTNDPNAAPEGGRRPDLWFNTANVTRPAPLTGGNLGLQTNYGPPTRTVDFSLFKNFQFTERYSLQFRSEAFNIGNTPQFGIPENNFQNANFGRVTSTQPGSERRLQFALRFQF